MGMLYLERCMQKSGCSHARDCRNARRMLPWSAAPELMCHFSENGNVFIALCLNGDIVTDVTITWHIKSRAAQMFTELSVPSAISLCVNCSLKLFDLCFCLFLFDIFLPFDYLHHYHNPKCHIMIHDPKSATLV